MVLMPDKQVIVIGAGVGGLVTAIQLAARGLQVRVLERAEAPGGKMREVAVGPHRIDAGPTVFTMRWIFEDIFEQAGARLDEHLELEPLSIIARHAWSEQERLDLHADHERSIEAIGDFAGAAEARGYRAFCEQARTIYTTLDPTFIRASRPSLLGLMGAAVWAAWPICAASDPTTASGTCSEPISRTSVYVSSSGAIRPTAVPRPSWRRPR